MQEEGHARPGYIAIETTCYLGKFNQIGKLYQIVLLDLFSNFAFSKIYTNKSSINVIDLMEMNVIPVLRIFDIKICNLVTNNSKEYATNWERGIHKFDGFLDTYGIEHWTFSANNKNVFSPINDFISILQEEFYNNVIKEDTYTTLEELEMGLNKYIRYYNYERVIETGMHKGKTPVEVIYRQMHGDKPLPLWFYIKTNKI